MQSHTEEQAREAAKEKLRELGDDPENYSVQVQEDTDSWRVMFFIADRRVRGGGYEVTVAKKTCQVQTVRRYQ